jgi:N-acetylmuramoyl-L-alanine amidase
MREVKYIVVHCTGAAMSQSIESIKNHWSNVLGWKNVGYHYIIEATGKITQLASHDLITNGVAGYNKNSIHVCWIGGTIKDNRTIQQRESLLEILTNLKAQYPGATIQGHRDFPGVKKACPQFDSKTEYKNL